MKTLGAILLLVGFLLTLFTGFQIATKELVDIDPEKISNPDIASLYWSPITALALIIAGVMVLFIAKKESPKISHR